MLFRQVRFGRSDRLAGWLSRFQDGPLEWLWRMLTYGVAIPLRTTQPRPSP